MRVAREAQMAVIVGPLIVLAITLCSCTRERSVSPAPATPAPTERVADLAAQGPFAVGNVTRMVSRTLPSGEQRQLNTAIWYPAVGDTSDHRAGQNAEVRVNAPPVTGERRPLVLFSHGRGSNAAASLPILSHLASYGFVVVGPDHQDCASACHDPDDFIAEAARRPDDIVAVLEHVLALSARGHDPVFTNLLDPARVGVAGASLGGFTALKVMEIDSRVRGAVLLAPGPTWPDPFNPTIAPPDPRNVRQPVMFIAGTLDTQVPFEATAQFFSDIPADAPERWFVEIRSAGHMLGQSHCIDFTPFIRCPELLPSSAANAIVARWATVFLLRHIAGETQLDGYLDATANKDAGVAVIHASPGGQTPQIVTPADSDTVVRQAIERLCQANASVACAILRGGAPVRFGPPRSAPAFSWISGGAVELNGALRYARPDAVAAELTATATALATGSIDPRAQVATGWWNWPCDAVRRSETEQARFWRATYPDGNYPRESLIDRRLAQIAGAVSADGTPMLGADPVVSGVRPACVSAP